MTVTPPASRSQKSSGARPDESPLLKIRDLEIFFKTPGSAIHAVNGVDLDVHAGEVHALVGESGSGKSVSMLSVMGLLQSPPAVVSGSMRFAGRELTELGKGGLTGLRGGEIGMVFQDPMSSLNPVHKVGKQIAEAIRLHEDVSRKVALDRAAYLLNRVGIPNARRRSNDYPHEFSGGMRQRAMIAMALACNPKLLIADEPTTALDVTVQRQIVSLVEDLKAALGMAIIWITHDLGVVAELADTVSVMYGGRIMETGPASAIYTRSRHPYTAGLLRSVPGLGAATNRQLPEIPGTPSPILEPLTACPFHVRCPLKEVDCCEVVPDLKAVDGSEHSAACLHSDVVSDPSDIWPADYLDARAARPDPNDVVLAIRDLRVYYRSGRRGGTVVRAVDGINLEVRRGLTLGIVGESGCGKSTLGRALVGLVEPEDPAITLDGAPLDTRRGAHRRAIQMIFQDPFSSMNPGMKVSDVIGEPLRIHGIGSAEERRAKAVELLSLVGLSRDAATRYPHEFSGGQRQRIAVARALAADPDVIICDEPVSSLDVSVQAQIINLLETTQEKTNVGLVFIAHDLAVIRHISDEIAVMYVGRIMERGRRDEIFENPLHPYTRALLAAVPRADPAARYEKRDVLEGDPPDPAEPPPGCRFHPRCSLAVEGLCDIEIPELREIASGRWVACHLVQITASGPALMADAGSSLRLTKSPADG
jgi:peptide/nickel transport system ATP-binding protein